MRTVGGTLRSVETPSREPFEGVRFLALHIFFVRGAPPLAPAGPGPPARVSPDAAEVAFPMLSPHPSSAAPPRLPRPLS